jgi:hypothetical protein
MSLRKIVPSVLRACGQPELRSVRLIHTGRKDLNNDHSIVDKDTTKASSYLKSILEGNQKWVDSKKAEDPEFFNKLAKPQTPKYLYFGCADSRVPANQILGKG